MPGFLDDETVGIPCPECEREISLKVAEIRKSPTVTCTCGQKIAIEGTQFDREAAKVDAAARKLDDTIKRINRKHR